MGSAVTQARPPSRPAGSAPGLDPRPGPAVNLASPLNATILDGQGRGTILDDDKWKVYIPLILRS